MNTTNNRKRKHSPITVRVRKHKTKSLKRSRRDILEKAVCFPFSNENILQFGRMEKRPKDCVINALELIGVIDHYHADLMRIAVGNIGLTESQILDIFRYRQPKEWKLVECKLQEIRICYETIMPPGTAIFCGFYDDTNHVFLIRKTTDSHIFFLDPQNNLICHQFDIICNSVFSDKNKYFVLCDMGTPTTPQPMMISK